MIARGYAVLAWTLLAVTPAAAERLITSVSNHQVMVNSNFTGEQLVLFGTVEQDRPSAPPRSGYDLVVTVTGPRDTQVTRLKQRVLGIWANVESRTFVNVPTYLAILTTKPADQIAARDSLRRLQIGLDYFLLPQRIGSDVADTVREDPFRSAFLRIKKEQGLYREDAGAITFLSPTLFRADIPLPAEVPFGTYQVDVKLFADGAVVARDNSALEVLKVGFEQFVANAAREHGFSYGLATAMMAVLTGWFASVVFRRD